MIPLETPDTDRAVAEALVNEVRSLNGCPCAGCGRSLCAHQALMNIALGFKNAPRCPRCLSIALHQNAERLATEMFDYLQRRECHRTAWAWANELEGFDGRACLQAIKGPVNPHPLGESKELEQARAAVEWDAGDMGCGDLVLELRIRLQNMRPGEILKLCARDPGAREDLPAWCKLTGHTLSRAQHPNYWIIRKK